MGVIIVDFDKLKGLTDEKILLEKKYLEELDKVKEEMGIILGVYTEHVNIRIVDYTISIDFPSTVTLTSKLLDSIVADLGIDDITIKHRRVYNNKETLTFSIE